MIPKTRLGSWSLVLIGLFFLLVASAQVLIFYQGPQDNQTLFSNPLLGITMLSAFASGILAFCTSLVSVVKKKERSIFVFLTLLAGLGVIFLLLGELFFPH